MYFWMVRVGLTMAAGPLAHLAPPSGAAGAFGLAQGLAAGSGGVTCGHGGPEAIDEVNCHPGRFKPESWCWCPALYQRENSWGPGCRELFDEAAGDAGCEEGIALADHPYCGGELLGRGVFEQKSAGAGLEGVVDVLVEVERRQDEDADLGRLAPGCDPPGGLDAVEAGHADVHQDTSGFRSPVTRAPSFSRASLGCSMLELGGSRGDGLVRSPVKGRYDTAAPGSREAADRQQGDAPQSAG